MKKKMTIFLTACFLTASFSFCQDSLKQNQKHRLCLVKLTMMNNRIEKYILTGFAHDTLYGLPFIENENKKMVQMIPPLAIKSIDIRKALVKIDKHVYMAPVQKAEGDTSISIKTIKSNIVETHIMNTAIEYVPEEALQMMSDPFSLGLGLTLIAIDVLFPHEKVYHINGSEKKFYKMVKDFSPQKAKSNEMAKNKM